MQHPVSLKYFNAGQPTAKPGKARQKLYFRIARSFIKFKKAIKRKTATKKAVRNHTKPHVH